MKVKRRRITQIVSSVMAKRIIVTIIFLLLVCSVVKNSSHKAMRSARLKRAVNGPISADAAMSSIKEDYSIKSKENGSRNFSCQPERISHHSRLRLKNFFRDETEWRNTEFNIFLTETSCNSKPKYRAWCSVESMAQQNPKATVWYVLTSPEVDTQDGHVHRLLQKNKNLRVVTIDLDDVFRGTPLEELYLSGIWYTDSGKFLNWPAANLSDMMRLALVWKVGGFYSDTDIICISSLAGLRNVIGMEAFNLVNGAIFHFDHHHPMLMFFMSYLNQNFNTDEWGKNGPQVVSAVLRTVCKDEILSPYLKCENLKILSSRAFHPVQPTLRKTLFQKSIEKDINKRFPYSYTIHFWNRDTNKFPIFKNSGTIIDLASAAFCPMTRAQATKNSPIY
ncbi:lactosylceramide 4-alpha-galactosyltransferase-like [Palaemon carinicauda]|uniref:lactosylceramide 4-alpha-galactosyltransferase-like n=1 Tax=Palaemon carinicauda TaxID=392227 RepID=UPI0035B5773E